MSSTITFYDNETTKITYLTHGASLDAIATFAIFLAQRSNAAIPEVTYTTKLQLNEFKQNGEYSTVNLFAKIMLRKVETGVLYCVILPAPSASLFEEVPYEGLRIKQAEGEAIAAAYSTMSDETFTFDEGWLCGYR